MSNNYQNAIRDHVDLLVRRGRTDALIVWNVGLDEKHDPTLIAHRAYNDRTLASIVMTCAGTNRIGELLPVKTIYLPKAQDVHRIKRQQTTRQT